MRWSQTNTILTLLLIAQRSLLASSENSTQLIIEQRPTTAIRDVDDVATGDVDDVATGDVEKDLLQWALKNSDPEELRKYAEAAKLANKNDPDAAARRERVAALIQAAHEMPSEAELMQEALTVAQNSTESSVNRQSALEAMAVLVEPVDNADHLLKMSNATSTLVKFLATEPAFEARAARVLGVAASNNPSFQEELINRHPDVILRLIQLLSSAAEDTTAAALFAAGQILRNSPKARQLWAQAAGGDVLVAMVRGGEQVTFKSRRRAVTLAGDLMRLDPGTLDVSSLGDALLSVLREQTEDAIGNEKVDLDLIDKVLEAMVAVKEVNGGKDDVLGAQAGGEKVVQKLIARLKEDKKMSEYVADVISRADGLMGNERQKDEL